jgi:NUDIX domain
VAEHDDLDTLGALASQAPDQHADQPVCRKVEEGQSHRRTIAWSRPCCSTHPAEFLNPTGLPGGRPEQGERWADTLRREVAEEACAVVERARLLGFTRGVCVRGLEEGLVLVRSIWRAEVRLERWAPRFEIPYRRLLPANEALRSVVIAEPSVGPIYRRMFAEAALAPTPS